MHVCLRVEYFSMYIQRLHLLRLLQKHYQWFDVNFYQPVKKYTYEFVRNNTRTQIENDVYGVRRRLSMGMQPAMSRKDIANLKEAQYYMKYARGSYGIALQTLMNPCAVCCALPCGMPKGIEDRDNTLKQGEHIVECCNCCMWDHSNVKTFLRLSPMQHSGNLLLAHTAGGS